MSFYSDMFTTEAQSNTRRHGETPKQDTRAIRNDRCYVLSEPPAVAGGPLSKRHVEKIDEDFYLFRNFRFGFALCRLCAAAELKHPDERRQLTLTGIFAVAVSDRFGTGATNHLAGA